MHRDAEVVFFLGDGLADIEPLINDKSRAFLVVRGNCDTSEILGDCFVKNVDSINLLGYRITFTHGNLYGVKYGLDGVIKLALDTSSDIVLFGHTHIPIEKYIPLDEGGIYLFNPGSISGGFSHKGSYGIIDITDKGVLFSHGEI